MLQLREKIHQSWDWVLNLEREDDGWIFGKKECRSIQATMWQVTIEQVVKAEHFIAK